MIDSDLIKLNDHASHTLRGFRHQALYILLRIIESDDEWIFRPEGIEDLAVYDALGELTEIVQVKSHTAPLVQSSFGSAFYRRISKLIKDNPTVPIIIASYGPIGVKLHEAIDKPESQEHTDFIKYINNIIENLNSATLIANSLRIDTVDEKDIINRVIGKLAKLCTSVEPQRALEVLWWWIYSASENRELLDRKIIIGKITQVGRFLTQRAAFHDEWFKTIIPLEDTEISNERRKILVDEFASGITARFEHIIANVDVRRDSLIERILTPSKKSNVTVIHGASGQGKTALAYRYCYEFYPQAWRFRIDNIENRRHAQTIAMAIKGHIEGSPSKMLVFIDVQPGNIEWVNLAKYLSNHQAIQILIAIREEDWRRSFGQMDELQYNEIELTLDEKEGRAIFDRIRDVHDVPHVLGFEDAWKTYGGSGPLLEFVYFLHHNNTLESRLQNQITKIKDSVRLGEIKPQELDLLRLAAVATAFEALVDLRKLANVTKVTEPQRTVELFEKEYFFRSTANGRYIVALHPIRSAILSRLLTDDAFSPWIEAADRALNVIREIDLERFLLFAFIKEPDSRTKIVESINTFQPKTWTGLCGCARALLWLGVRQYIDENMSVIRDAFAKCNEGWHVMLNFDVAGIADFNLSESFASLGEIGKRVSDAMCEFIGRQTETEHIYINFNTFMQSRSFEVVKPTSSKEWRSMGEVCFWLGHLNIDCSVGEWVNENLLTSALEENDIEAVGEACIGVSMIWGNRYQDWYEKHRIEIHSKFREALHVVTFTENEETAYAIFLLSRNDIAILTGTNKSSGPSKKSLNDLIVAKLRIIHNIVPFFERYGCKGIGHLTGLIDPPHDESKKDGILKKYLLPKWGPALNNLFIQMGNYCFRLPSWTHFADEVKRIRLESLDLFAHIREGILAHFNKKNNINFIGDYIQSRQWDSLKADCFGVHFMPQCAVDEFGLDIAENEKASPLLTDQENETNQSDTTNYNKSAREYARTLNNFLTQALPMLIWNANTGKARKRRHRKRIESQLRQAGINNEGQQLSILNIMDFAKNLPVFQHQIDHLFTERSGFDEHKILSKREVNEAPKFCLLWQEFINHPNFSKDSIRRISRVKQLKSLDVKNLLDQLKNRLEKALKQAGNAAISFKTLENKARWDSKPTLWIVCDMSDPCRILDATRIVESCLLKALDICRSDETYQFVANLNWMQIVVIPIVSGKCLKRYAYPYLSSVMHQSHGVETAEWHHIASSIDEDIWQCLGLELWQSPRLREFQDFTDALSELWSFCGHLSDIFRAEEKFDAIGIEIVQKYIQDYQESLNSLLQKVIDLLSRLFDDFNAIPDVVKRNERRMLIECISFLSKLDGLILPRKEWSGYEVVSLYEMKEWYGRLTEALGIANIAEVLWSADSLGLECDLDYLVSFLESKN